MNLSTIIALSWYAWVLVYSQLPISTMNTTLQNLLSMCEAFTGQPEYVYKSCSGYLVILEKLEDTLTNEARTGVVDPKCAKFRADKLKVVCIIDTTNLDNRPEKIMHVYKELDKSLAYIVGHIVYPDYFNHNINVICSTGIHYFKSLEPAFFYNKWNTCMYTGLWKHWHDNGQLETICNYVDGKLQGLYKAWNMDGKMRTRYNYVDGKMDGQHETWYEDGQMMRHCNIVNEKLHGLFEAWYDNGQMLERSNHVNGKRHGLFEAWNEDGQLKETCVCDSRLLY